MSAITIIITTSIIISNLILKIMILRQDFKVASEPPKNGGVTFSIILVLNVFIEVFGYGIHIDGYQIIRIFSYPKHCIL